MKTWSDRFVVGDEMALFNQVKEVVCRLPEYKLGKKEDGQEVELSCHLLARAVSQVFGLKYCEGHLCPSYNHSWVEMPSGHIIDLYPVGIIGGPVLWVKTWNAPAERYFTEEKLGGQSTGEDQPWFKWAIKLLVRRLRSVKKEIEKERSGENGL